MINLAGYHTIEEIYKSYNSTILRGIRHSDKIPVIIKLLNKEYPSDIELSYFHREFEITDKLSGDGIIRVYANEKHNNSLAIIMEDIGGISIAKVLKSKKLKFGEKLSLAVKITDALSQIHGQNVIHKDINPSNIIWNRKTNQLKIIDFNIAVELKREITQFMTMDILEGTLDYISPEQTGRMNRSIDYRTDLYSLGVTLYELFTEVLPFNWKDEAEIVYCHMAKIPIPPHKINPDIPEVLSDIIMKLLSKIAEERYQMAIGLKKDLELCTHELKSKGEIASFIIGQNDITDRFQIPQKLYGREKEIKLLLTVFKEAANGRSSLLLVDGYPGVGKSTLIHEIHKSIIDKKGYFISGKFDQLEKNIPYYAIIKAVQGLIRRILTESDENLETWKQRIINAVHHNAQLIIDLIPEVEHIIGPQPSVIELNPVEAQNRFHLVFREFINVFAKKKHPLVIFLDDLQWSDLSTLDLVKYLLGSSEVQHILFIGAYRNNEVRPGHPLLLLIDEIKKRSPDLTHVIHQLFLKPLNRFFINQLISDTFRCHPDKTKSLTDLVFQKTEGNPFFTNQLLNSLYNRGVFKFLIDKGRWEWDLKKVSEVDVSDNVVDLLVQRLELLPSKTVMFLKLAACIGNNFDLKTLSFISEKSVSETGIKLWPAVEGEIIYPLDSNYRLINLHWKDAAFISVDIGFSFQHDRIQQAVYSLIPEDEKPVFHLKIGREFLKTYRKTKNEDYIFDLVNHLNIGRELIEKTEDRIELSELNLIAGRKAKKSTAFATAANYFETGKSLLIDKEWSFIPGKRFELFMEHAEAVFLSGNLHKAEELCEYLFTITNSNIDNGLVYNLKTVILEFQARFSEAIDEIRKSLLLFNLTLPLEPREIDQKIKEGIMKMQKGLEETPTEELVKLPHMTEQEKILAMQLLFQVIPPARQSNPHLYILAALMMFDLTLAYGTTPYSCKCFVDCGVIQSSILGDYATAYKLGEASFALINKFKADSLKPAAYFGFTFISYWRAHYKESLKYYDMSYRIGLETGDIQHAAYARAHKIHLFMYVGENLTECRQETENTIIFVKESQTAMPFLLSRIILYIIKKFQNIPGKDSEIDFEQSDDEMIMTIEKINNLVYLGRFFQYNTFVNFIHGDIQAAEKWNMMAEKFIFEAQSDFPKADHYLFQSLILIRKWKNSTAREQSKIMDTLTKNLKKLENWSDNCPPNFSHKYYFLCAEMAIIQNESLIKIINLYKKALEAIGENDFIHMKALINESEGYFWVDLGHGIIGKAFIREAYYLYKQWGAFRKVAQFDQKYSHNFFSREGTYSKVKSSRHDLTDSQSITGSIIDMASIVKSNQAISSEIKIEKLLRTLMYIIIENAGAEHGSLLLKNQSDNELYIEAMKTVNSDRIDVMQSLPYKQSRNLCPEIIQYVARTMKSIVINNAGIEGDFKNYPYIQENKIKSVLCMPIIYQNTLKGIVYLENNLSDSVFTSERINIIKILSSQVSISIDNARLYKNLEEKVKERTNQLNMANKKLKELSLLDPLTALHNRRYIYEFVSELSINFIKNKVNILDNEDKRNLSINENVLGLCLIDIDHFKAVNDSYGHMAGDNVLITIAKVLKKMIRANDFIVRWGGEEFLIILNNTEPEYLELFSKKVLRTIKSTPLKVFENKIIYKTCSLGSVIMPFDKYNPELLNLEQTINLSDYALYLAKENGRDCAAHIQIKNQDNGNKDSIKHYLTSLSKNTEINYDYIEIKFIDSKTNNHGQGDSQKE
ncbi:MAG: AAA family ATPase [Spirochaetales bacterium]|nr:AAA family ATPase [Spirochaetales bacterium]